MKTEKEIRNDIRIIIEETDAKKKPKIKNHIELIKIANHHGEDFVKNERDKLVKSIETLDSIYPEYLKNFNYFRIKDEGVHKRKVRSFFKKEFGYNKILRKIERLNYLLGESDTIYLK